MWVDFFIKMGFTFRVLISMNTMFSMENATWVYCEFFNNGHVSNGKRSKFALLIVMLIKHGCPVPIVWQWRADILICSKMEEKKFKKRLSLVLICEFHEGSSLSLISLVKRVKWGSSSGLKCGKSLMFLCIKPHALPPS